MYEFLLKPEVHDAMEEARRLAELAVRSGDRVMPFAMLPNQVVTFATGGDTAEAAKLYWAHSDAEHIVVCYASTLVHAGALQPALVFRCRQRGENQWHLYVQLYQPKRIFRPYRRIGELTLKSIEPDAPNPEKVRHS